uniref:WAP domain-containing protein n=1 Tax=Salvator merianae TaxID=96440 RepID=A0A8D0C352_SALMN
SVLPEREACGSGSAAGLLHREALLNVALPFPSGKPGSCPPDTPSMPWKLDCQRHCVNDWDCGGPLKCCFNACAWRCVTAVRRRAREGAGTGLRGRGFSPGGAKARLRPFLHSALLWIISQNRGLLSTC